MAPYLQNKGIYATPTRIGRNGGNISLPRIKKDLNRLANSNDKVTTLYDFYGFQGKGESENKNSLEQKIVNEVAPTLRHKIIPYIQMYEFEGILFSSPEAIENNVRSGMAEWANNVLKQFNNDPEKINDSPQTAPSKRLEKESNYLKTIHGPNICMEIGLNGLRQKCAGFNGWLSSLEALQS